MSIPRTNPFAPGYGKRPPVFVGRDHILEDFEDALHSPQHPSTAMLLTGPRGIGKTVTLDKLAEVARANGWRTIRSSAVQKDWLATLTELIVEDHLDFTEAKTDAAKTAGLSAFGFGVDLDSPKQTEPYKNIRLRKALEIHSRKLAEHGTGLALLIDEIQSGEIDDVRALDDDHQLIAESEQLPITLTLAALPSLEAELEADNTKATFLQRMDRKLLARLNEIETFDAIAVPFAKYDIGFSSNAHAAIMSNVEGAPYFAQLLGFELWKIIHKKPASQVNETHVSQAASKATATYGRTVVDALLSELTPVERTFLMAMAIDDEHSDLRLLAERIERDPNYAYQYRHKLMEAGLIKPAGTRMVSFTDPAVRTHLRTTPQYEEFQRKRTA